MRTDNVFLGSLTHNGLLDYRMAKAFFVAASRNHQIMYKVQQTSLLASGCNSLWCDALNNRENANLKWFAMLHADIVPQDWWLDNLIEIAESSDADMLSAVVPIKGPDGVTSTAVSSRDPFVRFCRLTTRQVNHDSMPSVFSIDTLKSLCNLPEFQHLERAFHSDYNDGGKPFLLLNTGCFVCRIDRPWAHEVFFTIRDRIEQSLGGAWMVRQEPEDWFFSRMVASAGGKVMATKHLRVEHIGPVAYDSTQQWGKLWDPGLIMQPPIA